MWTVVRRELLGWLRRPRAMVWAGALQLGLILFVVAIWPDGDEPVEPALLARLVIYDFFEKLLFLILLITPLATASSFASERERATLHLLRLTRLSPLAIVSGKLISAVGYMFLLLLAAMPFLALLLSMGGVSLRSILLLHGFLAVTIIYAGLIGMLMSLWCRGTVRAVMASYGLLLFINVIMPSFQLGMQYYEQALEFKAQGIPLTLMDWPPDGENLYSTPDRSIYYLIDAISPLSVYLNFRFVQLRELRPEQLARLDWQPAGDYRMIYHYLIFAGIFCAGLLAMCVAALRNLSPRSALADRRAAAFMRGQAPSDEMVRLFAFGVGLALVFGFLLNVFDERAPMSQTIVAMWCLGALWGNAGANAVARERERDTLPLATLTGLRAGEYLSRSIQPAIQSGSMFLLGMGAGMFAASYSDLAETLTQKRLETEEIAQSMLCAAGFGVAALAIGLAFSAKCRTALAARVWTFLTLFALWLHWTLIGHLSMDVFGVIDESGYPIVVQGIFRSIAGAQIAFSTALIYLNPFAWLDLCFWHESAATFITIQGQRVLFDAASGLPAAPPMLERHEALFEGAWRLLAGTDPDEGASMAAFALITIALPMVSIAWLYRQVRRRLIEADFFVP